MTVKRVQEKEMPRFPADIRCIKKLRWVAAYACPVIPGFCSEEQRPAPAAAHQEAAFA